MEVFSFQYNIFMRNFFKIIGLLLIGLVLLVIGLIAFVGGSETPYHRELYSSCKGQFTVDGQTYDCAHKYVAEPVTVVSRVIPTVEEGSRGLNSEGQYRGIVSVGTSEDVLEEVRIGKVSIKSYIDDQLNREMTVDDIVVPSKNKSNHVETIFEDVDFLFDQGETVYIELHGVEVGDIKFDEVLRYYHVPRLEEGTIDIPLLSV
ncbi:MAG: hypothetical protein ACI9VM_000382 [Candidatus Azotimanducaceae bacterium]